MNSSPSKHRSPVGVRHVVALIVLVIGSMLVPVGGEDAVGQENLALCDHSSERSVQVDGELDGLLYCFDGNRLYLRNQTSVVIAVSSTAVATRHRAMPDYAGTEVARENPSPDVLPPGYLLQIDVGASSLEVDIRGDLDLTNDYLLLDLKAELYGFVPVAGDALQAIRAFSAWLAEMEEITLARDDCLQRSNRFRDIWCGSQFVWNVGFAHTRAMIERIPILNDVSSVRAVTEGLGDALDGAKTVATVRDLAAFALPATIRIPGGDVPPTSDRDDDVSSTSAPTAEEEATFDYRVEEFRRPDANAMVAGGSTGTSPDGRAVRLGDVSALPCRLSDLFNFCIQRGVPDLLVAPVAVAADQSDDSSTLFYSHTRQDLPDGTEISLELRSLAASGSPVGVASFCQSLGTLRTTAVATATQVRGHSGAICNHWDHGLVEAPITSVIWYEAGALHRVSVTVGSIDALTGDVDDLSDLRFDASALLGWVNSWSAGPSVADSDACAAFWVAVRRAEVVGTEGPAFLDGMTIEYSIDARTVAGPGPHGEFQMIGETLQYVPEGVVELLGTKFDQPGVLYWDREVPGIICTLGSIPDLQSTNGLERCSDRDYVSLPCTRAELLERVAASMGGQNNLLLGTITSADAYARLASELRKYWEPVRCGELDGQEYCTFADADGAPLVMILEIRSGSNGLSVSDVTITSTH